MINFVDLGLSCLWRKCPAEVAGRILLSNFRMFSVHQYSCNKTAREGIWSTVRNVSMIGAEQHSVFFSSEKPGKCVIISNDIFALPLLNMIS